VNIGTKEDDEIVKLGLEVLEDLFKVSQAGSGAAQLACQLALK